ncbi:MAG: 16S rRNA (cytidine(1402)-2'-O)-methyltransferase [Lachnospiraceae bacterium]|nr:16S rRNA (cytidine(1402)-2'-O)-methyltransferase [Lachnospiraceae bacterium]
MSESGKLSLVATPIGNLEDMSMRAIRTLKEADLIAAEDTRNSIKLLNHFDIKTEMTSYHEFNKIEKGQELVRAMQNGKNVALITDAGTPGISDPGEELVRMCISAGVSVTTIPGAAAFVNAAIISGLPCRRLAFEAFLPKDKKERERVLLEMKDETRTIIMYEAPHHLRKTLKELLEKIGDRNIALVRELTKLHEEVLRFNISEAISYYEENDPRGEYAIVIEGRSKEEMAKEARAKWEEMSLEEHMEVYLSQGIDKKEAMKKVAKDRGVSKRDVYNALLK